MRQISGTKIRSVFQIVSSGDYPRTYYGDDDAGPSIVSLNAGNSPGLWVGGGGLNAAFDKILTAAGQKTSDYGRRHIALVKAASNSESSLADTKPVDTIDAIRLSLFSSRHLQDEGCECRRDRPGDLERHLDRHAGSGLHHHRSTNAAVKKQLAS